MAMERKLMSPSDFIDSCDSLHADKKSLLVKNNYHKNLLLKWVMPLTLLTNLFFLLFSIPTVFAQQSSLQADKKNTVYLQLRWHHQFQFAGYYAAIEKGFYKEEGLDVRLRSGSPAHQPVSEVLSGNAQYAEGNSEVLYHRLQGKPLIALASIFQHSPSVLLTLKKSGIRSVHDLMGKRVMLANRNEDADFITMLLNEGVSLSKLSIVPSSYQIEDLISGKVDAFNSYSTNEPYLLKSLGIEYNIINPISYSVDFYSDILFTSEQELRDYPKRVKSMLRATLKGWRYALDNPEEIIELLKNKYDVPKSRAHLRFEAATMRRLILPDLIQIGHMNPNRWQHMSDTFIKAGVIPDDRHLDGFIYDDSPGHLPSWVLPTFMVALLLILITSSFTIYLHRFNRRMTVTQKTLQQSEERFKALSEATYGGIAIHENGLILECNRGLSDITGYEYDELIGMNGFNLIESKEINAVREKVKIGYAEAYETIGLSKQGETYPLSIKGKNIVYKGKNARVIGFIDITESKKTEEQLKLAASVFTHAREGIMITNNTGALIEVNDTFSQITGYSREEALGKNLLFLKSDKHRDTFYTSLWASLLATNEWSGKLWSRRKNGELFFELLTISAVFDSHGKTQNYVALFSDITEMKQHQQQLEHLAHYDLLTGLPNRMLLAKQLSHAMSQCEQQGNSLAVAYLDLDGFKAINDTFGHDVGDQLLIKLSQSMKNALREGDTLARIGGDEFVAVLPELNKMEDCEKVLESLLQAAMKPITISGRKLQLSTSIGVTLYPQDGVDTDQLMRHADQAMYTAKQTGKNRYHLFDIHKDKSMQTQHESIDHIKQGLEKGEFTLYYQPKVNMRTKSMIGVEALIRWHHPHQGLLLPNDFLPIINGHAMTIQLGEWVIDSALDQMLEWQSNGLDIAISVNIDAMQLLQEGFLEKLMNALAKRPTINPSSLQLEILETSALGDINEVLAIMEKCIQVGVSFSLDDFGTGFSSLTYLKRLPIELLKIDQSFVRDMLEDPDDRAIVMGVIGLASVFNRRVIAEGVESTAHGAQLLSMGCELAQGYGIAKPMPAHHIPIWLAQWSTDTKWLELASDNNSAALIA